MTAGLAFGPALGTAIVSVSGTFAATVAFLIARYIARAKVCACVRACMRMGALAVHAPGPHMWHHAPAHADPQVCVQESAVPRHRQGHRPQQPQVRDAAAPQPAAAPVRVGGGGGRAGCAPHPGMLHCHCTCAPPFNAPPTHIFSMHSPHHCTRSCAGPTTCTASQAWSWGRTCWGRGWACCRARTRECMGIAGPHVCVTCAQWV